MAVDRCRSVEELKLMGAMILVQVVLAGVNVFYKLAMSDGMTVEVLVAYRYLFAAAFLCPVAFVVERGRRPRLTGIILIYSFINGLFGGALLQNLYIGGMKLTSVTFVSTMTNLIPAFTFLLAVCFRLERLGIRTLSGQAKMTGTLVGIGGAMILTFYKGPKLHLWSTTIHLLKAHDQPTGSISGGLSSLANRVMGSLLSIGGCISFATWLIIQAKMSNRYPCPYSSTALMSVMGSLQAARYALIVQKKDWEAWKLGLNVRLLTVVYSGVVASGIIMTVLAWCIRKKGPLYVSIFNPLMPVIVAILGSLLLDEKLHIGSVFGALMIVVGLYFVLWGKWREAATIKQLPVTTNGDSHREGSDRSDASEAMGDAEQPKCIEEEIAVMF